MDTRTERAIQASLEKLCRGRTTIMIAHRLSTLRDCEKLYVIEHGSVAESGTHAQLIRQKGIYFKLYTLQYEALKNEMCIRYSGGAGRNGALRRRLRSHGQKA